MFGGQPTSAFAWEKITVSSSAVGVTPATASLTTTRKSNVAYITVETNSIRLRYDGGAATSANGHLLASGDSIKVEGSNNISNISMIRSGGADGLVQITYER